jgi:hypothetical protein
VPAAAAEFAAQNLGDPIAARCAVQAVATWRRPLSTVFVDISLGRVPLPGIAAADGVDPPRDDARGFDDSIAVVTDRFDPRHPSKHLS